MTPFALLSFRTSCWEPGSGSSFITLTAGCSYSPARSSANYFEDNLETASFDGKTWSNPKHSGGSVAGHYIHWHTFDDNAKSVAEDVLRIRNHPLVPHHIPIYGFIYDVKTGKLNEVAEASAAGRTAA